MAPWIRIRIELYRQLEKHVQLLLGKESRDLQQYREQFDRDFAKAWRVSNRVQLLGEVEKSDVILLADFHALQQSQKAQLRILKGINSERPRVLAVEFFHATHQPQVDRFMAGEINEKEFLKSIAWSDTWGFPWEHYRPLIRFAQKNKIPVVGLNMKTQEKSEKNLKARDDFAAEQIIKLRKKYSGHQVFVIFGDLHLASGHLPKSLAKKRDRRDIFRTLTVFQNSEKIFFRLLEKEQEVSVDVVRLSRDQFCLISVPPWVKWQNFLMYLEGHLDRELHGEAIEYTDHVGRYLSLLAQDFGEKALIHDFSIYTPEDEKFWSLMQKKFNTKQLRNFEALIQESKSFYVPELKIGYLARPTVNHAAQLAMAILHAQMCKWKESPLAGSDEFLKMIWLEAVQYFGTKMINPKRKTDTLQDIRAALASRYPQDLGQEALQLALHQKMRELLALTGQNSKWNTFRPRKAGSYREAARLLGGLLGEKLYTGLRKHMLSLSTLLNLFRKPVDGPDLAKFYFEIIELVEGLPDPFLSKSDKM